jgi:hypothetical protein
MAKQVGRVDNWRLGSLEVNAERGAWNRSDLRNLGEKIVDNVLEGALKDVRD